MKKNKDYLLEIGLEEVPARFMSSLLNDLLNKSIKKLKDNNIPYTTIKTLGTYRRLALIIQGLPEKQEDTIQEQKGPPASIAIDANGKFLPPAIGFAKRLGITPEKLETIEENNKQYLFGRIEKKGVNTSELFSIIIPEIISSLTLPIAMKWGNIEQTFIRPVHWFVSILGKDIVPFELFSIKTDRFTYGHRFLTKNTDTSKFASGIKIQLDNAKDLELELNRHYVLLDQNKRKSLISEFVKENTTQTDLEDLIEEITFLTEQPKPLIGEFQKLYLNLPPEVLTQCMQKNQKFIPILNKKTNEITNKFIIFAENLTIKNTKNILAGNEQVLKARLEDTRFFWEEDQKNKLEINLNKLEKVVFQKGMGTIHDKIERISKLATYITKELKLNRFETEIQRTVKLCKTDLVTNMVFELPILQGIMGRIYAETQGEDNIVAKGIEEHYYPLHSGGKLPETPTGLVVSLADKIDTIVCSFHNNLIPTGSQDPWALRRSLYGIFQIIIAKDLQLSILSLIDTAYPNLTDKAQNKEKLLEFSYQRFKQLLTDSGITYDACDSILENALHNPNKAKKLAQTIDNYRKENPEQFKSLIDTAVRINRLAPESNNSISPDLFSSEGNNIENICFQKYIQVKETLLNLIKKEDYETALKTLTKLSEPMSNYFDNILVMAKDPKVKENRLAFIYQINQLYKYIANFEKIVI